MKGHQSMHRAIARGAGISPTIAGNEIAGSDTNEPHLKFVVTYREAAKRKQKFFETEEEAYAHGGNMLGEWETGVEVLHMHNLENPPLDEDHDVKVDVFEVDA